MNLHEVLKTLAQAELSNLSLTSDNGDVLDNAATKVVSYVNEALLRLHSRFVLREKDLLLEMYEEVTTYEFKPQYAYAYTGTIEVVHRYIVDENPDNRFKDDMIRVLRVYDSLGCEMDLNNETNPWSLFTPRPKVLQVPIPIPGQSLSVLYQAKHEVLKPGAGSYMEMQEVDIPDILIGAMNAYVGYMAFNSMGGQENLGRAAGFLTIYNNICQEVEQKDSMGTATRTWSNVFERRGFV